MRQSRLQTSLAAKQLASSPSLYSAAPNGAFPVSFFNQFRPVYAINTPVITGVFIALLNNNKALIKIPSLPYLIIIPDISAIEKKLTKVWIRDKGRQVTLTANHSKVLSISPESELARDITLQEIPSQPKKKYHFQILNTSKSRLAITPTLETIYEDELFLNHSTDDNQLLPNDSFSESGYFYEDSTLCSAQLDDLSEEESLTDELSVEEEYLLYYIKYDNSKQADNSFDESAYLEEENEPIAEISYEDLFKSLLTNILRTLPPLKDNLSTDYPDFYKQFMLITNDVGFNYRSKINQLQVLSQAYEVDTSASVCCFFKSSKVLKNSSSTQFIAKIRTLNVDNLNTETIEQVFPTVESENNINLDF